MATSPTSGPGGGGVTAPATIGPGAVGVKALDLRVADDNANVLTLSNDTWDTDPADPVLFVNATDDGDTIIYGHAGRLLRLGLTASYVVFEEPNSAPADAALASGAFALWLDDTPAATKLMVKAKDSAGGIKTAAIALS